MTCIQTILFWKDREKEERDATKRIRISQNKSVKLSQFSGQEISAEYVGFIYYQAPIFKLAKKRKQNQKKYQLLERLAIEVIQNNEVTNAFSRKARETGTNRSKNEEMQKVP